MKKQPPTPNNNTGNANTNDVKQLITKPKKKYKFWVWQLMLQ